jgi:chorismate mutase
MAMDKSEELESLRRQVRNVTSEIMRNVHQRMELARQIGAMCIREWSLQGR